MKISWFKKAVSPEIGDLIAGYGFEDHAETKRDDLFVVGLCCDDGENKLLIVSCDLVGLDSPFIQKVRGLCAGILGIEESRVLLSCTHNHSGPMCKEFASHPGLIDRRYLDRLEQAILEGTKELAGKFQEAEVYFYSSKVDANRNRRYVTADNCASFGPCRRETIPVSTEFADKEFGSVIFCRPGTHRPIYVIGNYAAHPLAGHAPGLGGLRISADFPGAFRRYVTAETGAECMYISGAAGDMVPTEDELGSDAVERMGIRLGKEMLGAVADATRNPGRFLMKDAKTGGLIRKLSVPLRAVQKKYPGKSEITIEVQCVSIGDIAFVGLPDEPCAELGQEIKWHSPFRRTFIAYCATGFTAYICPANFLVAGGYEAIQHIIRARHVIDLIKCAVDTLFDLRENVWPSEGEPYPDNLNLPLVNIPKNN